MLFTLNLVFFFVLPSINSMRIGIIRNASLLTNCSYLTMNVSTCNECSCTMFNSSQNLSILSLNCHINNISSVTCELFTAVTYLNTCFYQMENNSNNIFYFQQLPSTNQSMSLTGRMFALVIFYRQWKAVSYI